MSAEKNRTRSGRTFRKRKLIKQSVLSKTSWESNHRAIEIFQWLAKNGYKTNKKLRIHDFLETGRGLMTKENIHSGETILSLPFNILITADSVLNSDIGTYFRRHCINASSHEILSIFLMFEKSKGLSSKWHSYIETLPKFYNIPAYYGTECLDIIPSILHSQSERQIESLSSSYNRLETLLSDLENEFPFFHGCTGLAEFKWAWCSVNTRCVFIDCFKKDCTGASCKFHMALAPFLDLLNHNSDVQTQAGFNRSTQQYEIKSLCEFKKHSQVFINYGAHDNCKLLLEYGFIIPNNFNETVSFSVDKIRRIYEKCGFSISLFNKCAQFITANNLDKNLFCSQEGLSWNLNIILRILSSIYDTRLWKSKLGSGGDFPVDATKLRLLSEELLRSEFSEHSRTISKSGGTVFADLAEQLSRLCQVKLSLLSQCLHRL